MTKPPLNYTTKIPAKRTLSECQELLAEAGAMAMAVAYQDRNPSGLSFRIDTPNGAQNFILPVNVDGVARLLATADYPSSVKTADLSRYVSREHAYRVGWRVLRDWLEAQLAIVAAGMVTLDEIMLPYLQIGKGETLYRALQSNQLALTAGSEQ
jgi:hypothetical protein